MSDAVYKTLELTGSSSESIEDAVNGALRRAAETVRNMRWIQITDVRGNVAGNRVDHWQVTTKVGFTLE